MAEIRKKSLLLTGYLELLIDKVFGTENGDANDEEPSAKRSVKNGQSPLCSMCIHIW